MEKLINLSDSGYKERLVYVKNLAELIEILGDEGINKLN